MCACNLDTFRNTIETVGVIVYAERRFESCRRFFRRWAAARRSCFSRKYAATLTSWHGDAHNKNAASKFLTIPLLFGVRAFCIAFYIFPLVLQLQHRIRAFGKLAVHCRRKRRPSGVGAGPRILLSRTRKETVMSVFNELRKSLQLNR